MRIELHAQRSQAALLAKVYSVAQESARQEKSLGFAMNPPGRIRTCDLDLRQKRALSAELPGVALVRLPQLTGGLAPTARILRHLADFGPDVTL